MSNTILSGVIWESLAAEYLLPAGETNLDVETNLRWSRLLAHIYANTNSNLVPEGERGGIVSTWIGEVQLDWEPRTDADDVITSFEVLKVWASVQPDLRGIASSFSFIPLSDLHHDHPYFSRADNLVFRAWHDTAHLEHNLGFGHDDELRLYGLQAKSIPSFWARDALFCESIYQLAASVVLDGYPEKQYCRRPGPVGQAVRDLLINL